MTRTLLSRLFFTFVVIATGTLAKSQTPINVWPSFAPGETTQSDGVKQPVKPNERPPVTRVAKVTMPSFTVHRPQNPNGSAVVILPGGGFRIVVPDKEGTEAADFLAKQGITSFVLSYRTTEGGSEAGWKKPLQDAQRTIALVRSQADRWGIRPHRIGLLGFSAGGQVAARLLSDDGKLAYPATDEVDQVSHRPDFSLLVYPWKLYDTTNDSLVPGISVTKDWPPTFLVHTHNDRSSSLGTVLLYAGLKRLDINAELHVYGNGGHGYGLRPIANSQISTWPTHAGHWITTILDD